MLHEVESSTAKVAESRLLCFDFFFHVRSPGHLRSSSKDAQTLTNTSDATTPCEQPARNFAKELLPTVATEKEPPGRPPLDQRNPHRAPNFMFNLLQVGQRAGVQEQPGEAWNGQALPGQATSSRGQPGA